MRESWKPLLTLQRAKQPVMALADGLDGGELAKLTGVPISTARDADWALVVETQEQLDSLVDGANAVLSHEGTFPDFAAWRAKFDRTKKEA